MAEWREAAISDLALGGKGGVAGGPFGSSLGRKHYATRGVPVIRGAQLSGGGRFSLDDLVFVSDEKADRHAGNLAYPGDVIVTQRGTLGQVGLVPQGKGFDRFLLSQSQMKIAVDPAIADAEFVYFALRAPEANRRLIDHATTSGVPHINLDTLRKHRVSLPDLSQQRRIAALLSAFDNLVEISKRRIELLEDLARSLYREWFVHFRFPGYEGVKLVDSELGLIPEDWSVQRIKDVTSILTRGIAPKYAEDGRWTVVNQRCIRNQRVTLSSARRHEGPVADKKQLRFGDVLINSTGVGTLGRVAVLLAEPDLITVDSHVTIARPSSLDLHPWFGLHMLGRESAFQTMGTGSTGQTELGRAVVGELPLVVPSAAVLAEFSDVTWSLLQPIPTLWAYGDELAATRDLLLPRLVTGQLDIADVDLGVLIPEKTQ
jgi:type I restriction enzyme S subunit